MKKSHDVFHVTLASLLVMVLFIIIGCSLGEKAALKLQKQTYAPGEMIVIEYSAPKNFDKTAWIGIIPSDVNHGNETENDQYDLTYKYLNESTSGQMSFLAPENPGKYDFRMHDTDNNGKEVASVTFVVEGKAAPEQAAAVGGGMIYNKGDKVMIEWKNGWYPGQILQARENCFQIHYDGYSDSWDECVGTERLKRK